MSIDAFALQRYPKRAKIALLEHVGTNASSRRLIDCRTMNGATVAKNDLIGNAITLPQRRHVSRQFAQGAAKEMVMTMGALPVRNVSRVEVNFHDAVAVVGQATSQALIKGRANAL